VLRLSQYDYVNAISPRTQAQVVIGKFGSACKLAKLLGVRDSTVYRWTYARANGGTDGIIPGAALRRVLELARQQVPPIVITAQDLYPS
jgi:DNA-binding transcriptional regulator YdaS (Cro superfamily)